MTSGTDLRTAIVVDDENRLAQHGRDPQGQVRLTTDILGMRGFDINGELRDAIY